VRRRADCNSAALIEIPRNFSATDWSSWRRMRDALASGSLAIEYFRHASLRMEREDNVELSRTPLAEWSQTLPMGRVIWFRVRLGPQDKKGSNGAAMPVTAVASPASSVAAANMPSKTKGSSTSAPAPGKRLLLPPDDQRSVEIGIVMFKTPLGNRWEPQITRSYVRTDSASCGTLRTGD
jgi:hypothetical protein